MKDFFRHIIWLIKGVQVYALVGKSGTGKSFRAKLVAEKYGIELIVDDGLLIRGKKILAGKSAKKEIHYVGAIKTAFFDNTLHRTEVSRRLEKERFKRLLIIGTSAKMAKKIAHRLGLPSPSKILTIEDVATSDEITSAMHSRKTEGKHVIPVPAVEVQRDYPHIFYDSVRVFLKSKIKLHLPFPKKSKSFEKAVVRPRYGKSGKVQISESALTQMVLHCTDEFDQQVTVEKVVVKNDLTGYKLNVHIQIPFQAQISGDLYDLRGYISESIERYTGVPIHEVVLTVSRIAKPDEKKEKIKTRFFSKIHGLKKRLLQQNSHKL